MVAFVGLIGIVYGSNFLFKPNNTIDDVAEEWKEWKKFHEKVYRTDEEDQRRIQAFIDNRAKIALHNSLFDEEKEKQFNEIKSPWR